MKKNFVSTYIANGVDGSWHSGIRYDCTRRDHIFCLNISETPARTSIVANIYAARIMCSKSDGRGVERINSQDASKGFQACRGWQRWRERNLAPITAPV